ncbi:MAG TPA: sulfurtransferase [Thermoanaerobaculia bacterium]|nr:sulfurtransferase [Thermoanaerobaculia bacterium]
MKRFAAAALLWVAAVAHAAVNDKLLVSTTWLASHLGDRHLTIVHVGTTPDLYNGGHVPGAVFLALDSIMTKRGDVTNELPSLDVLQKAFETLGIGNRGRIVIYGDDPLFAARLFFTLDYAGHGGRAALLDGGFAQWKREQRAIDTRANTLPRGEFTARVNQERLGYLSQLKRLGTSSTVTFVDARPPKHFSGEEAGEGVSRAGHIPSAVNVPWNRSLNADGLLLPPDALLKIQTDAGVKTNGPIITYCRTGMQASFEYFVLRYLGFDPALYDGSYVEWSGDPETAVEARH